MNLRWLDDEYLEHLDTVDLDENEAEDIYVSGLVSMTIKGLMRRLVARGISTQQIAQRMSYAVLDAKRATDRSIEHRRKTLADQAAPGVDEHPREICQSCGCRHGIRPHGGADGLSNAH